MASIRPFGELKLPYVHAPGASALTSQDSCPWRKASASAPETASNESGDKSQTTAASRAAVRATVWATAGSVLVASGMRGWVMAGSEHRPYRDAFYLA